MASAEAPPPLPPRNDASTPTAILDASAAPLPSLSPSPSPGQEARVRGPVFLALAVKNAHAHYARAACAARRRSTVGAHSGASAPGPNMPTEVVERYIRVCRANGAAATMTNSAHPPAEGPSPSPPPPAISEERESALRDSTVGAMPAPAPAPMPVPAPAGAFTNIGRTEMQKTFSADVSFGVAVLLKAPELGGSGNARTSSIGGGGGGGDGAGVGETSIISGTGGVEAPLEEEVLTSSGTAVAPNAQQQQQSQQTPPSHQQRDKVLQLEVHSQAPGMKKPVMIGYARVWQQQLLELPPWKPLEVHCTPCFGDNALRKGGRGSIAGAMGRRESHRSGSPLAISLGGSSPGLVAPAPLTVAQPQASAAAAAARGGRASVHGTSDISGANGGAASRPPSDVVVVIRRLDLPFTAPAESAPESYAVAPPSLTPSFQHQPCYLRPMFQAYVLGNHLTIPPPPLPMPSRRALSDAHERLSIDSAPDQASAVEVRRARVNTAQAHAAEGMSEMARVVRLSRAPGGDIAAAMRLIMDADSGTIADGAGVGTTSGTPPGGADGDATTTSAASAGHVGCVPACLLPEAYAAANPPIWAQEEVFECSLSYRVPELFLRARLTRIQCAQAAWARRFRAERIRRGFFISDDEAREHGHVPFRVRVMGLDMGNLFGSDLAEGHDGRKPGAGSKKRGAFGALRAAASALASRGARPTFSTLTGGASKSCSNLSVRVSLRNLRGRMGRSGFVGHSRVLHLGRTNTEYASQRPRFGTNVGRGMCAHTKPTLAFAAHRATVLLEMGERQGRGYDPHAAAAAAATPSAAGTTRSAAEMCPTFVAYLPLDTVSSEGGGGDGDGGSSAEIVFEVVHEAYSLQDGVQHVVIGSAVVPFSSAIEVSKKAMEVAVASAVAGARDSAAPPPLSDPLELPVQSGRANNGADIGRVSVAFAAEPPGLAVHTESPRASAVSSTSGETDHDDEACWLRRLPLWWLREHTNRLADCVDWHGRHLVAASNADEHWRHKSSTLKGEGPWSSFATNFHLSLFHAAYGVATDAGARSGVERADDGASRDDEGFMVAQEDATTARALAADANETSDTGGQPASWQRVVTMDTASVGAPAAHSLGFRAFEMAPTPPPESSPHSAAVEADSAIERKGIEHDDPDAAIGFRNVRPSQLWTRGGASPAAAGGGGGSGGKNAKGGGGSDDEAAAGVEELGKLKGAHAMMERLAEMRAAHASPPTGLTPTLALREIAELEAVLFSRFTLIMSQALTVAVSTFVLKLELILRGLAPPALLHEMQQAGFLLGWEGLLSAIGKDLAMLGDARAAIDALAQLRIEVMRATPAQEQEGDVAITMSFQPDVSDDAAVFGFAEDVVPPAALRLHIRSDLLRKLGLDAETRAGAVVAAGAAHSQAQATPVLTVRLVPVLFAQGINEMQSLADTGWAKSSTAHADINEYFLERLTKHLENVAQCRAAGSPPVAETATISLRRFVREARGGRKKLTAILTTAADVICAAGGARVVFCKSGKDRTAMAVTLEQARLLQRACQQVRFNGIAVAGKTDEAAHAAASFNLAALSLSSFPGLFWRPGAEGDNDEREDVIEAANLQREFGVRLRVSNKNVGRMKYAFNTVQRKMLPRAYRPPNSTLSSMTQMLKKGYS